jgi:hypothetical protein
MVNPSHSPFVQATVVSITPQSFSFPLCDGSAFAAEHGLCVGQVYAIPVGIGDRTPTEGVPK